MPSFTTVFICAVPFLLLTLYRANAFRAFRAAYMLVPQIDLERLQAQLNDRDEDDALVAPGVSDVAALPALPALTLTSHDSTAANKGARGSIRLK